MHIQNSVFGLLVVVVVVVGSIGNRDEFVIHMTQIQWSDTKPNSEKKHRARVFAHHTVWRVRANYVMPVGQWRHNVRLCDTWRAHEGRTRCFLCAACASFFPFDVSSQTTPKPNANQSITICGHIVVRFERLVAQTTFAGGHVWRATCQIGATQQSHPRNHLSIIDLTNISFALRLQAYVQLCVARDCDLCVDWSRPYLMCVRVCACFVRTSWFSRIAVAHICWCSSRLLLLLCDFGARIDLNLHVGVVHCAKTSSKINTAVMRNECELRDSLLQSANRQATASAQPVRSVAANFD